MTDIQTLLVCIRKLSIVPSADMFMLHLQEGCGMRTKGLHTQIYRLDNNRHPGNFCLSGTAEVGIAGRCGSIIYKYFVSPQEQP